MCKGSLFISILRVFQLTHAVELAITEVDNPIRRQEEAIEDIDRQDPVERAERELRSNPARIPCANECKELPARAKRSFGFIGFVGVIGQERPKQMSIPASKSSAMNIGCQFLSSVRFLPAGAFRSRSLRKCDLSVCGLGVRRFSGIRIAL